MDKEFDNLEGMDSSEVWWPVDGCGDYAELLNQHMDVIGRVEDRLYKLATAYLLQNPYSEFSLATLVGQDNSNEWDVPRNCRGGR